MKKHQLAPGTYIVRPMNGSPSTGDKIVVLSRALKDEAMVQQELAYHRRMCPGYDVYTITVPHPPSQLSQFFRETGIDEIAQDATDINRTHEDRTNPNFVDPYQR